MKYLLRVLLLGLLVGHPVTAGAGSLTLLGVGKPASVASFSLTPESSSGTANQTAPISYSSLSWGSNTRLLIGITYISGATTEQPTSLSSLGGGTYTKIASSTGGTLSTSTYATEWWISSASVGSASGQTLTVTYNGTGNTGYVTAVAVYSLNTTTPTPNAVQVGNAVFGLSVSTSSPLAVPLGGGGVVGFIESGNVDPLTPTNWAIDTALNVSLGGKLFNWGRTNYTNASNTVSTSWTTNNSQAPISTVSWGP